MVLVSFVKYNSGERFRWLFLNYYSNRKFLVLLAPPLLVGILFILFNNSNENNSLLLNNDVWISQLLGGGGGDTINNNNNNSTLLLRTDAATAAILLPRPLELLRRNIKLETEYNQIPSPLSIKSKECSCENPLATPACCKRSARTEHKFGVILTRKVFKKPAYVNDQINIYYHLRQWPNIHMDDIIVSSSNTSSPSSSTGSTNSQEQQQQPDFRDVMIFRNIYAALVSGYQYHSTGYECSTNANGTPMQKPYFQLEAGEWEKFITASTPLNNPKPNPNHQSLCDYLAIVNEEIGMRVYIEWVFHVKYDAFFSRWGLSREIPTLKHRTLDICFEDLASPTKDKQTLSKMIQFLYNTGGGGSGSTTADKQQQQQQQQHDAAAQPLPQHTKQWIYNIDKLHDTGGHSTSKDPNKRQRLANIIKQLDKDVFGGEIEWLNSILPC